MTVVKVVEDIAFGAHWPCQSIGRGLCAKVQTGGSPRASREPLVASADEPSVGSVAREKNRVPFRTVKVQHKRHATRSRLARLHTRNCDTTKSSATKGKLTHWRARAVPNRDLSL